VKIEKKERQLEIKEAELQLCEAQIHLDQDPKSESKQKWVKDKEEDLKKVKGETAKGDKTPAQQGVPDVKISGPDRTTTGFSIRSITLINRNRARN
jgi:hypothetical protein